MPDAKNNLGSIMIVEDSPTQAEMLKYVLEEEGFSVLLAANGEMALDLLLKHSPQLIISDIIMPKMNGYELCKRVKANDRWQRIPFILLTTLSDTEDVIKGLESQADYFISKSHDKTALVNKLRMIIKSSVNGGSVDSRFEQEICYGGAKHQIRSTPYKTLNLLLTVYDMAIEKNNELQATQNLLQAEIDRRAELEIELKKARDAADAASRAKSTFLASMSHEIRTPMNAILGFSQLMLRDNCITTQQRERLETINRSGEHLLALINDILDISKIEAGRVIVSNSCFNLHALLTDMEAMFRVRADAKDIRLILEMSDTLEQYVISDEGKLRQILINLISNAIKFTREGGVAIRVRTDPKPDGMLLLMAEVEDTGPGIEEGLDTLFQVFSQTQTGREAGGTGLGLAISRQFARLMGGDIAVWSQPGYGSRFMLELTLEKGTGDNAPEVRHKKVVGLEPGAAVYRILVVDDKKENREFLTEVLECVGFSVKEAVNGEQAINWFKTWKPHLIMMDLRMPGLDGIETTRRIKEMKGGAQVHVIMVTATAFDDDLHTLLASGAELHVRKPFRIEEIYEAVGKCLPVRYILEEEFTQEEKQWQEYYIEALESLPTELREELAEATINAQLDRLLHLIDRAEASHAVLARRMRELANNFQYDALTNLFGKRGVNGNG